MSPTQPTRCPFFAYHIRNRAVLIMAFEDCEPRRNRGATAKLFADALRRIPLLSRYKRL